MNVIDNSLDSANSDSDISQNSVENGRPCVVRFRHCEFTFERQIFLNYGKLMRESPIKTQSPAKKTCLQTKSNNIFCSAVKLNFQKDERICGVLNLAAIFKECFKDVPVKKLIDVACQIDLSFSEESSQQIEFESRHRQSDKESQWKTLQVGRVCGSVFKSVCHSELKYPKQLLSRIYQQHKDDDHSSIWLRQNFITVRSKYERIMINRHKNFTYRKCGLILRPDHPQFCVSPGGIVQCDCCGRGITEFYTPYEIRNEKMIYSLPCLDETDEYDFHLRKDTSFYYKCQIQMFLTDTKYCDFVIWTTCDYLDIRIKRDDDFLFVKVNTAKTFFIRKIMPDLLSNGSYFGC